MLDNFVAAGMGTMQGDFAINQANTIQYTETFFSAANLAIAGISCKLVTRRLPPKGLQGKNVSFSASQYSSTPSDSGCLCHGLY